MQLSVLLSVFSIFLLLITFLLFLWKRRYLYYHATKVRGPFALPLVGCAWMFLAGGTHDMLETALKMVDQYDAPLIRFWLGPELVFIVKEPKYIEILLTKFLERPPNYRFLEMVFGDGLFTTGVAKWRRHRKVIALTFNQQILTSFMDIFVHHSKNLTAVLNGKVGLDEFNLFPVMSQCALDCICETSMGTKVNAMSENSQYADLTSKGMELTSHRIYKPWLHPDFLWKMTAMSKELTLLSEKFKTYAQEVIERKREEKLQAGKMGNNGKKSLGRRKIFLDHLIDLTDDDVDNKWSDVDLIEETRTVIISGCDATASTATFAMMMLAMHSDIQDRVFQEVNGIFGDEDRDPTVEDLAQMPYLEMCIKETLRLFPVGSVIGRSVTDDIRLDNGVIIPKGSLISVVVMHLHRDPKLWQDPLKFDPDRFLPEEMAQRHPYCYIPFSGGPRNCIGFRYAMMALKTVISTLVRQYTFTSPRFKQVSDVKLKMEVSTKCHGDWSIALRHRNSKQLNE